MIFSTPFAPLLSILADRAGMMVSPKAAKAHPTDFANNPVCSGQLDFIERVATSDIAALKSENKFNVVSFPELGYVGITTASYK